MTETPLKPARTRSPASPRPEVLLDGIPARDRWAIDPASRQQRIYKEMERRLRLSRYLLEPENQKARDDFAAKCQADPAFFFRHCVWTKDPERNMSNLVEIPLIPYTYLLEPVPDPQRPGEVIGGWLQRWTSALLQHTPGAKTRLLEEKTRRTLLSITCTGFLVWAMRFFPGFHGWLSSDSDEAIDHGEDWDALFAKVRYIWFKAHEFYPWLYPALPPIGKTSVNKDRYIEFPKWCVGEREVARECWGNKLRGLTPNEVSGRGGAAFFGFIDEAGWVGDLEAFLDNIEQMTPLLILASTPPRDSEHPFARRAAGDHGYNVSAVHWTANPVMVSDLYWDETGDVRGVYTQRWRSPFYDAVLKTQPSHVVARNYDLDYRSVAGDRIFIAYTPQAASASASDVNLYDPRWPLEIWYDVGRRDPWACLWVQVSDATKEVRIVDFWMRAGVSVHWWLPIWLGWNPDRLAHWRSYPDMRPWFESVPWRYGPEDLELMRRWYRRFGLRPDAGSSTPWNTLRPTRFIQDAFGKSHGAAGLASVEDVMHQYDLRVISSATTHNLEHWLEHANQVLTRTKISPHIADRRPRSGGRQFPSLKESFLSWRWLPRTEREKKPQPAHDIHSHTCTAFVYGAMQLPGIVDKQALEERKLGTRRLLQVNPGPARDRTERITGMPPGIVRFGRRVGW